MTQKISVVDHINFNADPDPAFYLNVDPDPGSQPNADPDWTRVRLCSHKKTEKLNFYIKKVAVNFGLFPCSWISTVNC